MTRFESGINTLQFDKDPARPGGITARRSQQRERSSDGEVYVYGKNPDGRTLHRLSFSGHNAISDAVLTELQSFMRTTVIGIRKAFTWIDHLDVSRTVRFESPKLAWQQIGPNRNAVEIILEEIA